MINYYKICHLRNLRKLSFGVNFISQQELSVAPLNFVSKYSSCKIFNTTSNEEWTATKIWTFTLGRPVMQNSWQMQITTTEKAFKYFHDNYYPYQQQLCNWRDSMMLLSTKKSQVTPVIAGLMTQNDLGANEFITAHFWGKF